jgi:predicted  nucleic acid-binding Zn-ribbon protein
LIGERIDARLTDIESAIARAKARADAEVAALQRQRQALRQARTLVTPELEAAVVALQAIGLLQDL